MVWPAWLTSVCCTPADASLKPTLAFVTAVKDIVWLAACELAACGLANAGTANAPPATAAAATPAPMMEVRSFMVLPFLRGGPAPVSLTATCSAPRRRAVVPRVDDHRPPLIRPEDYAGLAVGSTSAALRLVLERYWACG